MFNKFSYVCAVAALLSTNAHAQKATFDGLSIGLNTEFKSTTVELAGAGSSIAGFGQQNTGVSVSADYGVSIGDRVVLLLGGKMDLVDATILKIEVGNSSATLKEKNHYSVFVAPGIILNNTTLGYVKLGWETSNAVVDASGLSESQSYTGVGYGAGLRTHLNGGFYANIEAMRVVFDTKSFGASSTKTGSTLAAVGLTYKF